MYIKTAGTATHTDLINSEYVRSLFKSVRDQRVPIVVKTLNLSTATED